MKAITGSFVAAAIAAVCSISFPVRADAHGHSSFRGLGWFSHDEPESKPSTPPPLATPTDVAAAKADLERYTKEILDLGLRATANETAIVGYKAALERSKKELQAALEAAIVAEQKANDVKDEALRVKIMEFITKLQNADETMTTKLDALTKRVDDHDGRLKKLEEGVDPCHAAADKAACYTALGARQTDPIEKARLMLLDRRIKLLRRTPIVDGAGKTTVIEEQQFVTPEDIDDAGGDPALWAKMPCVRVEDGLLKTNFAIGCEPDYGAIAAVMFTSSESAATNSVWKKIGVTAAAAAGGCALGGGLGLAIDPGSVSPGRIQETGFDEGCLIGAGAAGLTVGFIEFVILD